MIDSKNWFTEQIAEEGVAFSLKITEILHQEQTEFQHIAIYQTERFGKLMVIDGCIMLSDRDNFIYHEMMSHPAIFSHPDPKTVWIIGGGDCGTLTEVLKHNSIEQVIQIEIDPRVTQLSEQFFPRLCATNDDPRAQLQFIDGIQWVKDAEPACVDIIIIDSTDPVGPAEGLFAEAFYRNCYRCLSGQGILIQQSESPLLHINILGAMHQAMNAAGFEHCRTLFFPQCVYPSGWWSATMASKAGLQSFREQAVNDRTFSTDYYNAGIHRAALASPEFFNRIIKVRK